MNVQDFIDDYHNISNDMYRYSEMFYRMIITGKPILTKELPTAAVAFDKEGRNVNYLFNPEFVEKLNWEEIKFVVCHEMLHILLSHGIRAKDEKLNREACNVAMDIVVNHMLISRFGFAKDSLPNLTKIGICLIDTVFEGCSEVIEEGKNFEYYYLKLKSHWPTVQMNIGSANGGSIDDHSNLPGMTEEEVRELLKEAMSADGEAPSKEEVDSAMEDLKKNGDNKRAGTGPSTEWIKSVFNRPRPKQKWSSIVSSIRKTYKKKADANSSQWVKETTKYSLLPKHFIMPSVSMIEDPDARKFDLWLFQDVSGSCVHMFERFITAARSIPKDVFNVKFHTFDTSVKKVDLESKSVRAGGGTSFEIIERFIQNESKKTGRYPKLVFVITDGYGDCVIPEKPDRWFWFLSENCKQYIPTNSKTFMLSQFEE